MEETQSTPKMDVPKKRRGHPTKYATDEERRKVRNEYQRKMYQLNKTKKIEQSTLWNKKNMDKVSYIYIHMNFIE